MFRRFLLFLWPMTRLSPIMDKGTEQPIEAARDLRMGKEERLRHKRLVDRLFGEGKSFYAYPLRVVYVVSSAEETLTGFSSRHLPEASDASGCLDLMKIGSLQVMVSVPKRKMRHAVDRVWLRRRVREAWRLSRVELREMLREKGLTMSVALVYVSDEKHPYRVISQRMVHIMDRLAASVAGKEGGET